MKQRPRIYYTATQKALMWERWQKGDNLHQIRSYLIGATLLSSVFWPRVVASDLQSELDQL